VALTLQVNVPGSQPGPANVTTDANGNASGSFDVATAQQQCAAIPEEYKPTTGGQGSASVTVSFGSVSATSNMVTVVFPACPKTTP
jgi:hypothetical protein